jgi:hypothetical protein
VISFADTQPLVPENPLADENRRLSILAQREKPPPPARREDDDGALLPDPLPGSAPQARDEPAVVDDVPNGARGR